MDVSKMNEILNWHAPRNVSEVRTFMSLCGYYRRYVQKFANIAGPLHELTRVDTPVL